MRALAFDAIGIGVFLFAAVFTIAIRNHELLAAVCSVNFALIAAAFVVRAGLEKSS